MNGRRQARALSQARGFTIVEAMVALALFSVGWAGVLGLITSSFATTARTWKSKNADQIIQRQFWELFYRVKTQGDERLDLADVSGTFTGGNVFRGELLPNGRGVRMIVVGRSEFENLKLSPPRVFIPSAPDSADGFEFYPNAGGDSGGFLVEWERSEAPTGFNLGNKVEGNSLYSFVNEASGLTSATYDIKISVSWPYNEDSPEAPARKIERAFSLGVY